jgi:release factor glutamine methyltransferase
LAQVLGEMLADAQMRITQALALDRSDARRDAQVLVGHALQLPRAYLLAHGDDLLTSEATARCEELLGHRLAGEPVAYILGQREFYGLTLRVTPAVLIPRPETELLVELALALTPADSLPKMLDLGTGSGAIALAIAKHRPHAQVTALDCSTEALGVAQENAVFSKVANIQFVQSDWFAALGVRKFDTVVSNPPYVAACDPHLRQGDLRFEPAGALVGGSDGLDCIRKIIAAAPAHLSPGGWLLLEHGYDQAQACQALLHAQEFREVASHPDLSGTLRVTGGRL